MIICIRLVCNSQWMLTSTARVSTMASHAMSCICFFSFLKPPVHSPIWVLGGLPVTFSLFIMCLPPRIQNRGCPTTWPRNLVGCLARTTPGIGGEPWRKDQSLDLDFLVPKFCLRYANAKSRLNCFGVEFRFQQCITFFVFFLLVHPRPSNI